MFDGVQNSTIQPMFRSHLRRRRPVPGAAARLLSILLFVPDPAAMAQGNATIAGYHGGAHRRGSYVVPGLTWQAAARMRRDRGFAGAVTGQVYAQPLY
jgi:hypothetical protein